MKGNNTSQKKSSSMEPFSEMVDIYTYVPSKGGFLKPIRMEIPLHITFKLKKNYFDIDEYGYWYAVNSVKMALADLMGIPRWEETFMERMRRGDISAPIQIIQFKKVENDK